MKKKRIVIMLIALLLVISSLAVVLMVFKNKKSDDEKFDEGSVTQNNTYSFALDSKTPSISDFCDSTDGRVEIYFNDELYTSETLDKIGEYKVKIFTSGEEKEYKFNVYDKTNPEVSVKDVNITEGEEYKAEDFIETCTDNSKEECIVTIVNDEVYSKEGEYEIKLSIKDSSDNAIEEKAMLKISKKNEDNTKKDEKTTKVATNTKEDKTTKAKNSSTKTTKEKTTKAKKVETKKETSTETKQGKYGVTETVTTITTYDVYSDGSIKNKKTSSSSKFDYSSYNAKAKDLIPEAKENRQKYAEFVNQILTATNGYRSEVGASPLVLDEELTLEAMVRAIESAYTNKMDHKRPDGASCFTISKELGMESFWGENLAWGQRDGNSASTSWRNSPGHYANMIGSGYTKLGIGVVKFNGRYWYFQVFA